VGVRKTNKQIDLALINENVRKPHLPKPGIFTFTNSRKLLGNCVDRGQQICSLRIFEILLSTQIDIWTERTWIAKDSGGRFLKYQQ
jgi:hypothetical protein